MIICITNVLKKIGMIIDCFFAQKKIIQSLFLKYINAKSSHMINKKK